MSRRYGLYLHKNQRDLFIRQLRDNYKIYSDKILPALSENASEDAENFRNQRITRERKPFFAEFDKEYVSVSNFLYNIELESFRYNNLMIMQSYRLLALWICCTCELWEQQMLQFLYQEMMNKDIPKQGLKDWNAAKQLFKKYGIKIEKMGCWGKINELRLLTNVLKHSNGDSEKKLRKMRPGLFEIDGCDRMELYHTALGDVTLNIDDKDLKDYTKALIEFWKNIPVNQWLSQNNTKKKQI